jgi:hypothetical protein
MSEFWERGSRCRSDGDGDAGTFFFIFIFSGCAADLQRRISSSYPCKLLLCVCVCLLFTKLRFIGEILFFLRPLNARRIISQALDSLPSGCPLHIYTHRGDRDAHTCVDRIIDPTTFSPYSFWLCGLFVEKKVTNLFAHSKTLDGCVVSADEKLSETTLHIKKK